MDDAQNKFAESEYPVGTPWWAIMVDRRAHALGNFLYVSAGTLLTVAPALYEMLPQFQASLPPSLMHYITSAVGALMLAGKTWGAVQNAKKMKESTQ